jgi:hypothetical protein
MPVTVIKAASIAAALATVMAVVGCSRPGDPQSSIAVSADPPLDSTCPEPLKTSAGGGCAHVADLGSEVTLRFSVEYMSEVIDSGPDEKQISAVAKYLRTF